MKKLLFVFVAMFVFSGLAVAQDSKARDEGIRCRVIGCNVDSNKADLMCYEGNKKVSTPINVATTKVIGVELYNKALDDSQIHRSVVFGPVNTLDTYTAKKKLEGFSLSNICGESLTAFCKSRDIGIVEPYCKSSMMIFRIVPVPAQPLCDKNDMSKKICI